MAMFVAPWPFRCSSIAFLALLSLLEQEVITRGVPRHSTNRAKSGLRVWGLLVIGTLLTRRALYFQAAPDEESTAYLRRPSHGFICQTAFGWTGFWGIGLLCCADGELRIPDW